MIKNKLQNKVKNQHYTLRNADFSFDQGLELLGNTLLSMPEAT